MKIVNYLALVGGISLLALASGSAYAGVGLFAKSPDDNAIRGEAGNVTGFPQPLGEVGVAGIGQSRGVYGSSGNGLGIHGISNANYGGYFYSNNYRSLYASSPSGYYAGYLTNRGGSTAAGLYVNGTILASGSKSGYVVDICLNDGPDPLETGDVVAVVGVSEPVIGEIPVMRVVKATADNARAVVGIVDQRFELSGENEKSLIRPAAELPRHITKNALEHSEYLSVVTLGAYKAIKVDANFGAIKPGDLLTSSPNPGFAMHASDPEPGKIIGKALDFLDSGQAYLSVYVTLQ